MPCMLPPSGYWLTGLYNFSPLYVDNDIETTPKDETSESIVQQKRLLYSNTPVALIPATTYRSLSCPSYTYLAAIIKQSASLCLHTGFFQDSLRRRFRVMRRSRDIWSIWTVIVMICGVVLTTAWFTRADTAWMFDLKDFHPTIIL